MALIESPARQQEQIVTIIEIDQQTNTIEQKKKNWGKNLLFAMSVNTKLPWFIISKEP